AHGHPGLTQSPAFVSVSLREGVSITRGANESVSDYLSWYQQKSVQAPKHLIYDADNLKSGVPDQFSGQWGGTDFAFTISSLESEDAGTYYCLQSNSYPPTVLQVRSSAPQILSM
ncbi:unnamed protein product, partial [Gulo gulo]